MANTLDPGRFAPKSRQGPSLIPARLPRSRRAKPLVRVNACLQALRLHVVTRGIHLDTLIENVTGHGLHALVSRFGYCDAQRPKVRRDVRLSASCEEAMATSTPFLSAQHLFDITHDRTRIISKAGNDPAAPVKRVGIVVRHV